MIRCLVPTLLWGCSPTIGSEGGADDSGTTAPGDSGQPSAPADCELQTDLSEVYYTEGDTVRFVVSCGAGVDAAATNLEGYGLPDGATFDGGSGVFEWQTGATDGGRVSLTFSVPARVGQVPETTGVTFWIADNPTLANAVKPDPATYHEEWGLPVVHIDVGVRLTESEQPAQITVRGHQVEGTAKIRGAFSASYTKPSYTLDFDSEELGVAEWGDRTRGHMVLITSFDDISYVRQKLIYDLWREMADHQDVHRLTPRTFFTVVYIDGVYQGLYTGCDRIDDEFVRHMGFESGEGNLYKAVSHDANFKLERSNGASKTFLGAGYEKAEGLPADDFSDLVALVGAIGGASDAQLASGDFDIDLAEFMDWFLLVSFALAEDSAGKNSYLYHGDDSSVFRYIPWDFNHSWGQDWRTLRTDVDDWNEYRWHNRVFIALQDEPQLQAALKSRAEALYNDGPLNQQWLINKMASYYQTLGPAPARDWAHWASAHRSFGGWDALRNQSDDWLDHDGERAYMEDWIRQRDQVFAEWLREVGR